MAIDVVALLSAPQAPAVPTGPLARLIAATDEAESSYLFFGWTNTQFTGATHFGKDQERTRGKLFEQVIERLAERVEADGHLTVEPQVTHYAAAETTFKLLQNAGKSAVLIVRREGGKVQVTYRDHGVGFYDRIHAADAATGILKIPLPHYS